MQPLHPSLLVCECSLYIVFWEKAQRYENVMTHCEFCHPLGFAEELQAQYTPTSHGSFHSSVVRESLWMREGAALTAAVNTVVVITSCHRFCCFLRRSHERQLSTPPMKTKNKLYSTMRPCIIRLTLVWKPKLNINLTTTFYFFQKSDISCRRKPWFFHATCYHLLARQ